MSTQRTATQKEAAQKAAAKKAAERQAAKEALAEKEAAKKQSEEAASMSKGAYDIRKGAAGYASAMGSVAGFVVPTVILVLTVPHKQLQAHPDEFTLIIGFLVQSLLGCLLGSFAFAALSGEEKLTANLPAAALYMGVGVILSIVGILAAFALLANIFLSNTAVFFAAIVACGGIVGAIFNGLGVIDDWEIRVGREADVGKSTWFASRAEAQKWGNVLGWIGSVPILIGFVLYLADVHVPITTTSAQIAAGVGIVATVAMFLFGAKRTIHQIVGFDKGIGKREAILLEGLTGFAVLAVLLFLPN